MKPHDPHLAVSPRSRSGREVVFPPYLLTGGKLSKFPKQNLEAVTSRLVLLPLLKLIA